MLFNLMLYVCHVDIISIVFGTLATLQTYAHEHGHVGMCSVKHLAKNAHILQTKQVSSTIKSTMLFTVGHIAKVVLFFH